MRPFIFCCLLAFFSSSALSTGVPSINIDAPVDPVNAKLESITDNPNNESMLKRRYEWRAEFNEIPADRLKPAPDDWDPPRWDAYQRALAAGYRACMPTCCGYNDCVADRSYCTNYCLERGQVTGMAINPKTGKMAPPARMAKRDDNPGGSIERRTSRIIDFPPENLLPRPADWDLSHWTRYQHDLVGAFVGCMPRCCGMKRCDKDPDELPWCQQHCMDMGHNNNNARFNPKTGKAAPHPSSPINYETASEDSTSKPSETDSEDSTSKFTETNSENSTSKSTKTTSKNSTSKSTETASEDSTSKSTSVWDKISRYSVVAIVLVGTGGGYATWVLLTYVVRIFRWMVRRVLNLL